MPKLKMPRKSTHIDMTAMCDVAFLLLSFFMLATKFKPDEPVVVVTPASISQVILPDADIMLITVDTKGRVFFSVDNKIIRKNLIEDMNEYKGLNLTENEMNAFAIGSSIGVPFNQLKSYLSSDPTTRQAIDKSTPGVPADTSVNNPDNELAAWIRSARNNNPKLRICIKADGEAAYPSVHKIIATLAGWKIFKFNLITNLKAVPPGTYAAEAAATTTAAK
ncbi:MAG: biopolymer transporter ExbD [Chitinophagaceae bacterium]|uniref:Biopolymer transporter ExbD n=1 Tax=Rurimicrobium arvi TaxID=2049916 RepID=A0ABP8MTQ1_9BACT